MTIDEWLRGVSEEFADAMIPTARLDAEIILAHTISHPRTWLHAHGDELLDPRRKDIADARAELRLERVPIAYIIGHKEFYGRRFNVSPHVLIPRPESESLIELLKRHLPDSAKHLVDVGTGSGCLGITAKLELPQLSVTLVDIDKNALKIAKSNAISLQATVRTLESNLLDAYPLLADIVIANLPYVDRGWTVSVDTESEPDLALYADDHGLKLIKRLIDTLPSRTSARALILLEADTRQHEAIIAYATKNHLSLVATDGLGIALRR